MMVVMLLINHKGFVEKNPKLLEEVGANAEEQVIMNLLRETFVENPTKWHGVVADWKGVSKPQPEFIVCTR